MMRLCPSPRAAVLAAFSVLLLAGSAPAQQQRGSGNFLDDLFSRGEPAQSRQPQSSVRVADPSDVSVRLDRMERVLRQLTGTIEHPQYRNHPLPIQPNPMQ